MINSIERIVTLFDKTCECIEMSYSNSDWYNGIPSTPGWYIIKISSKKIAPEGSLLAENLQYILTMFYDFYNGVKPEIKNVLMYFHRPEANPVITVEDFEKVYIPYSRKDSANYIELF